MNAAQKAEALKLARRTIADIVAISSGPQYASIVISSAREVLADALVNARRIVTLLEG